LSYLSRNVSIVAVALLWELIPRLGLVRMDALPPLTAIFAAWLGLLQSGELVEHGAASLSRAAAGVGIAITVGATLGIAMAWWTPIRLFFRPLLEAFYPVPKSALIPVTALWLGLGSGSKILLIALGCLLPVAVGAYNGARGTERVLIWSARGLGATRLRTIRDVVVPSALPELLNGIRTALALSFVLLVSSEMIVARNGFGYLIGFLGSSGAYDGMFAVVLTVAMLGFLIDCAYQAFTGRLLAWQR
jgi:NitT/TauT family transport system permease protein